MNVGIPLSPLSLRERARVRAVKGFLAIENFRALAATSMDGSEESDLTGRRTRLTEHLPIAVLNWVKLDIQIPC